MSEQLTHGSGTAGPAQSKPCDGVRGKPLPARLRLGFAVALATAATGLGLRPVAAEPDPARYTLRAAMAPAPAGVGGRFALSAQARARAAPSTAADGRFAMKAVAAPDASCGAADAIFANSFESP